MMSADTQLGQDRRPWWLLLLPISYLFHLAEEWWGGEGFVAWTALAVGSPVSPTRFIVLNSIVWPLFLSLTVAAILRPKLAWFPAVFATVVLVNAGLHILGSLVTSTYSPGLVTGILLYLPVGTAALLFSRRHATPSAFRRAVLLGVLVHAVVAVIAFA
jgi:hypothetical protein